MIYHTHLNFKFDHTLNHNEYLNSIFDICYIFSDSFTYHYQIFVYREALKLNIFNKLLSSCDYKVRLYNIYEIQMIVNPQTYNSFSVEEPFFRFLALIPPISLYTSIIEISFKLDYQYKKLNETQIILPKTFLTSIRKYLQLNEKNKELESLIEMYNRLIFGHCLRMPSRELTTNALYEYFQILSKTNVDDIEIENSGFINTSFDQLIFLINKHCININVDKITIEDYTFSIYNNVNYIYILNKILIFLITNCIKYTESVDCFINLYDKTFEGKVINLDTGISKHKLTSLFNRYRNKNNFKDFESTDLEFKIQGEELLVNSVEGKEIYFNLKYIQLKNDNTNPENSITNKLFLKENKILLIEDNPIFIKLIKSIVEKMGIEIDITLTSKIGINKLHNNSYDLILMEINMPDMNGYEVSQYIRKTLNLDIPIISMTANNYEKERIKCFENGINDLIIKPFKHEQLNNILLKYLNKNNNLNRTSFEEYNRSRETGRNLVSENNKEHYYEVIKSKYIIHNMNSENMFEYDLIKNLSTLYPNIIIHIIKENVINKDLKYLCKIYYNLQLFNEVFGLNNFTKIICYLYCICKIKESNE